jgi:uncharacterized membrane protein
MIAVNILLQLLLVAAIAIPTSSAFGIVSSSVHAPFLKHRTTMTTMTAKFQPITSKVVASTTTSLTAAAAAAAATEFQESAIESPSIVPISPTTSSATITGTAVMSSPIKNKIESNQYSSDSMKKKNSVTWTMSSVTAALLFATTLLTTTLPANAAMSGGRMGGSFSRSSGSYSGGRSSYGGGYRGSSSVRSMTPSRSSSYGGGSSTRSYYNPVPRSSTTIITAPIITPFYNPFYNPYNTYYGAGTGVGAISYARGPGLFDLLFLGGIGFVALSALSNTLSSSTTSSSYSQWDDTTTERNGFFGTSIMTRTEPVTVVKCSIALDVANRDDPTSILSVLDRMAKVTAKTDTRQGVITLTKQVALELLRRKANIHSASGSIQQCKNEKDAQRTYNQWSVQERSKFEQENINKFGKFDLSLTKTNTQDTNRNLDITASKATMAVVTLVLSVEGLDQNKNSNKWKDMSTIRSRSDLITLLQAIAAMDDTTTTTANTAASSSSSSQQLLGAEILWTPEDRSETLTKQDMIADYPELTIL